ncbi:MAG: calcium/sodium antiporter [Thiohalomonadales bacterium]
MLLPSIAVIGGLLLLVWSSDKFVEGASGIASNFGVSPLLIGMLIIGFGTSAPEILVGATASLNGNSSIAVGNAIGSNIANIALVLGIAALISPLTVESLTLRREFPVLLLATGLVLALFWDHYFSRIDGVILLIATLCMLFWMYKLATKVTTDDPIGPEYSAELPASMSTKVATIWTIVGLLALVISAYVLVWGAVAIAREFGISDLIIGLTIIAVGTSLPEVAVSITAALKKEHELVLGNIIGSNLFNLLAVLGVAGAIRGSELDPSVLSRDYFIMVLLTVAMFIMAYGFKSKGRINRFEASVLVMSYIAYMILLYQTASS